MLCGGTCRMSSIVAARDGSAFNASGRPYLLQEPTLDAIARREGPYTVSD
jgi:hypothetical protein